MVSQFEALGAGYDGRRGAWVFEDDDGADDADDTLLKDLRDSVNYVSYMKCGQSCYNPLNTLIPTDSPTAGGDDDGRRSRRCRWSRGPVGDGRWRGAGQVDGVGDHGMVAMVAGCRRVVTMVAGCRGSRTEGDPAEVVARRP